MNSLFSIKMQNTLLKVYGEMFVLKYIFLRNLVMSIRSIIKNLGGWRVWLGWGGVDGWGEKCRQL